MEQIFIEEEILQDKYRHNGVRVKGLTRREAEELLTWRKPEEFNRLPMNPRDLIGKRISLGWCLGSIIAEEWVPGFITFAYEEDYLD